MLKEMVGNLNIGVRIGYAIYCTLLVKCYVDCLQDVVGDKVYKNTGIKNWKFKRLCYIK